MSSKNILVIFEKNDVIYSALRTQDGKWIKRKHDIAWLNNLANLDFINVSEQDTIVHIETCNYNLYIDRALPFLEKYNFSPFVQKIFKVYYQTKLNNTAKKVTRENKHSNKIIGSVATVILSLALTFYLLANSADKQIKSEDFSNKSETEIIMNVLPTKADYYTVDCTEVSVVAPTTEIETTIMSQTTTEPPITTTAPTKTNSEKDKTDYDYLNDPNDGFIVTYDNKKYDISDEDFNLMCAVVRQEAGENRDEALAVCSVILNRCDNGNWGGSTPRSVITHQGQFTSYLGGKYKKFMYNTPDCVISAVRDSLNGIRNCKYETFRSNDSTYYGDIMLTSRGNRYK